MIKLFQQGYKVTATLKGRSKGTFVGCLSSLDVAKELANKFFKYDGVEAVRVYSRNRAEYRYGVNVVYRLIKDEFNPEAHATPEEIATNEAGALDEAGS